MKIPANAKLLEGKAYALFCQELERHIAKGRRFILLNEALTAPILGELSAAFHTVRGGAGFFGLDDMQRVAGELETIFGQEEFNLDMELEGIRALFSELISAQAKMPVPKFDL